MKTFKDFITESVNDDNATEALEQALIKLKVDVNQIEGSALVLTNHTVKVKSQGANISVDVRDFDNKKVKSGKGSIADMAKLISAVKGINESAPLNEKVDHRKEGQMGRYALEGNDTIPQKGQHIDFYDRNGDKQYGKVTASSIKSISVKTSDGTLHKMDIIKP